MSRCTPLSWLGDTLGKLNKQDQNSRCTPEKHSTVSSFIDVIFPASSVRLSAPSGYSPVSRSQKPSVIRGSNEAMLLAALGDGFGHHVGALAGSKGRPTQRASHL